MGTKSPTTYTRATLAKAAGVGVETLRFYEQKEVLAPPLRNASGYRVYTEDDLERLKFIQRAQGLGFSLTEIKELMDLTGNIRTPRAKVRKFAEARLLSIREKIQTLKAMERALGELVTKCNGTGPLTGCPIVEFVEGKKSKSHRSCHEG